MANVIQVTLQAWKVIKNGAAKYISVAASETLDLTTLLGGAYVGEYDSTKSYSAGQIVRTTKGTVASQALLFGLPSGASAAPGQTPTFPETAPWHCLGLAFQQIGVCSNGQKTITIQATSPF